MHITAAITSPPLIYLTHHIASRIYRHRHRAIDEPRISRMNRGRAGKSPPLAYYYYNNFTVHEERIL
jgi:hypothetical protein